MRKQQKIHVFGLCLSMAVLTCPALGVSPESQEPQQEAVYKVNQTRTYKVMFPKSGYIGTPASAAAIEEFRHPTREEHFKTCYIRVTVVADRKHKGNRRIVLRMDEIDENLKLIREALYHAYIDILPEGVKIICRRDDDNGDSTETNIRYGIPFPFECARPPQLGFKETNSDGHRDEMGYCVKYFKKEKKDDSPVVSIEAERFENLEGLEDSEGLKSVAARPAKWYKAEVDDVVKSKKTKILYRENQKWVRGNDWLWDEMERFDKDGNILMKCKKIQ